MNFIFIGVTVLISILAFEKKDVFNKLKFNPYMVLKKKEWGRLFSHGLIHADWGHLIFNMITLYFFGNNAETYFTFYATKTKASARKWEKKLFSFHVAAQIVKPFFPSSYRENRQRKTGKKNLYGGGRRSLSRANELKTSKEIEGRTTKIKTTCINHLRLKICRFCSQFASFLALK